MDAILFNAKRVHLLFQHRLAVRLLDPCALTPARFDALYALEQSSAPYTQARLRRALGISGPTLSRMLGALEKLAFVSRVVWRRGARRAVHLTRLGRSVLKRARKRARRERLRERIDSVLHENVDYRFENRETLDDLCGRVRRNFHDTATVWYGWHPDD
jgi:DNA-binding MarR family transcriptional regulator